jgi:hypothetical protein
MIISGISREDLEAARDVASRALGNEIIFEDLKSYSPKRHRLRLEVKDIDSTGARHHYHKFMLGYRKQPRRSRHACAHCYGFFFVAIFERNPDARVRTANADYRALQHHLGST